MYHLYSLVFNFYCIHMHMNYWRIFVLKTKIRKTKCIKRKEEHTKKQIIRLTAHCPKVNFVLLQQQ